MTKWLERANIPSEEGFYWAKTSGTNFWDLIVEVYGDSPFFKIDVWQHYHHEFTSNASIYDIDQFGPLIALEPPKMEGVGFK